MKRERGASLVEASLILSFFLILVLGGLSLAEIVSYRIKIFNALREASRVVMVASDSVGCKTAASAAATAALAPDSITLTLSIAPAPTDSLAGFAVTGTASYKCLWCRLWPGGVSKSYTVWTYSERGLSQCID